MPFTFRYRLHRHGWAEAILSNGVEKVVTDHSYICDTLNQMAELACGMLEAGSTDEPVLQSKVLFDEEGAEYELRIEVGTVPPIGPQRSVVVVIDQTEGPAHDIRREEVLRAETTPQEFAEQVLMALEEVLQREGLAGYRKRWIADEFPLVAYAQLAKLLGRREIVVKLWPPGNVHCGHNPPMASDDLRRLWKLAQIDNAILEIRQRAAALDPGRSHMALIQKLEGELEVKGGEAKRLSAEQTDLELAQRGIDDKLKKIDKTLYGGSVVSPREVENLEKEIAQLKRQREANDEKLLELYDTAPAAKAEADKVQKAIDQAKAALAEHQKGARKLKAELEDAFKARTAERPEAAKHVSPALLQKYEAIRAKHQMGMVAVVKHTSCGGCGTLLPERTLQGAKDDKVVTCDECHRILYYTEGLI